MQSSDPCVASGVKHVGDACAAGCAHGAHTYSLPPRVAGRSHGDVGGDGGDCCYDVGGYGHGGCSESPPHPPPLHPLPLPPSPQAGACGGASGCSTVLQGHLMFGCAGCGCDDPTGGGGGGDDGGGGFAEVSLVQFSGAALPPLFGSPQSSLPVLGLKEPPGLDGSPGNPSSWGQLTFCFSAHPATRKCDITVTYMHVKDTHM